MQNDDYLDHAMRVVGGRRPKGEHVIDQDGNTVSKFSIYSSFF